MIIRQAVYVSSCAAVTSCPAPDRPEYAFLGRSNVGKSSLINMLTGQKNLARISSRPGKTQTIQHYLINGEWYLVDLPGIGYARTPLTLRRKWEQMIARYLLNRISLMNTFLLVDSRLAPQKLDLELVDWFGENQLPFTILFTKTDKTTLAKGMSNIEAFQMEMSKSWEELPQWIRTSARTHSGREDILRIIEETNRIFLCDNPSGIR
ncbi:MAG: ribosome biogenesis GTP-binding protein YihA/YsxC [Bacteroidales bacterium]|nr:YihA family ribosome biogenesis GTP-binding protein [Lentimicrobiaceae bacterium]MDD5694186.1 ribosome biogenesis GTP-binding protein YihA/YsxC [Bacteroidales bacterium]